MSRMPTCISEISFTVGPSTTDYLHLSDEARGLLGTATLAPDDVFADVSSKVRNIITTRGSTRVEGPIVQYEAGTSTTTLKNADRAFDPTNLDGPYVSAGATQVEPMRMIRHRATWDDVTYDLSRHFINSWDLAFRKGGRYADVVVTASDGFKVLEANERAAIDAVGAGEDSGARVSRILDSTGWDAADRLITTGDSTLQATTLEGSALAELQLVADTEIGELYIDGAGRVVFRHRHAILEDERSRVSQATFGVGDVYEDVYDDIYGSEGLKYQDVTLEYDDEQIVNVARVTRVGGVQQVVEDVDSRTKYLTRTYDRSDLLMEADDVALDYARFIVYQGKDAELRFSQLIINPRRDPENLFPQVLGREIGDRITIGLNPAGGGSITRDVFIRGISHDITPDSWLTTWTLQSATKYLFMVLDHDTLGVLGTNALGYGTTAPGTEVVIDPPPVDPPSSALALDDGTNGLLDTAALA